MFYYSFANRKIGPLSLLIGRKKTTVMRRLKSSDEVGKNVNTSKVGIPTTFAVAVGVLGV